MRFSRAHGLHRRAERRQTSAPGSPPVVFWDSVVGNPSSVFVGPGGDIITSGGGDPLAPPDDASPAAGGSDDIPIPGSVLGTATGASLNAGKIAEQTSEGVTQASTEAITAASIASPSTEQPNTASIPTASQSSGAASTAAFAPTSNASTPLTESTAPASTATPSEASQPPDAPPSASVTPPARVNSASSSSTPDRSTSFYIGIAFAAIAGVGLVVAVLAWWLRIRSRTRRRTLNRATSWPWDHDRLGGRQLSLEGGLGIHGYGAGMLQRYPPFGGGEGLQVGEGNALPHPPSPAHIQPGAASPYVTIPLHGAHQSVPDLAPDLGTLQITNLAPGDLSSGDESSRASTALGILHTYPAEYGTPFQPHRPCFLGVDSGGLDVPWAPLRVRRAGSTDGETPQQTHSSEAHAEKLDEPLPYPGDFARPELRQGVSVDGKPAGWAASIRSNLLNAYNTVVGANPSLTPVDNLTHAPSRTSPRKAAPRGPRDATSTSYVSRSNTGNSFASTARWGVEGSIGESAEERGAHGGWEMAMAPAQDPFVDDLQIPEPALTASRDRTTGLLCVSPPMSLTRASSMYSAASAAVDLPAERICDDPPRLPSIPSLSRSNTEHHSDGTHNPPDSLASGPRGRRPTQGRKKTRKQGRPALLTRKSSSQDSATSVGSDMSRASSACSELTDGERFAKHALRERRRRVMEMSVGRGKTRRARATTLSRRRSNERTRHRRE